jgi:benzoylsuccinyl-CoA thiolase BbsB subunit
MNSKHEEQKMRDVVVLGVGQSVFGKQPNFVADELGAQAAIRAIEDAGIDPRDIQVAYGSRAYDANTTAQLILERTGITRIEMNNVENACASGSTAVHLLWRDIAYGIYDIGIAVGVETMTTSSLAGKLIAPGKKDLNGLLGASMPSHFALIGRRLMETRGATMEDLAYPSVKNHRNACMNPAAQYQKRLTTEEIVNSRMVSDPLTLLQCCPFTDGAAAVVLCSEAVAKRHTTKLVKIASSVIMSGDYETADQDITKFEMVERLAKAAYEKAGIGPEDLDLIELHDAFSPEEICTYESLGICAPGDAISFMRSGATDIGGKIPVNPSGGLLSLGHPLGASGVRVVCEITLHLRGEAGERQIPHAKMGMAEMVGGYITGIIPPVAGGIQILKK